MKLRYIFFMMLSLLMAANTVVAQDEYDDMYFNKKDRQKITASRVNSQVMERTSKAMAKADEDVNPTDSYSARNVNPEYTSRANSEVAQVDNEDYFDNSYQLQRQTQMTQWNRNYNNWYNNSWYTPAYYGAGINRWNSPYYGSYYDQFNSPWYDPYYRSAWSSSFSYAYGNNYNYGWGMNSGYGCPNNYWNSSWYSPSYSSWYSPFNSWGYSPYGYGGYRNGYYGYPTTIVVVENGHQPVYGKRGTRGTTFVQPSNNRSRSVSTTGRTTDNQGGRVTTRKQDEYYQRTWSNTTTGEPARQDNRSTTQYNRSSTWGNPNSSPSWSNTSRSSSTSGGATRSHSTTSGSGTNGRSRGRD
jgi:hypothetical protein